MTASGDAADRAEQIEQRYVEEYDDAGGLVEGLDPDRDADDQTAEQVKAAAPDSQTEREVDEMASRRGSGSGRSSD